MRVECVQSLFTNHSPVACSAGRGTPSCTNSDLARFDYHGNSIDIRGSGL